MSHFCVLVIGSDVEEQLAKYDENLELEMHQVKTKEEIIASKREWIANYKKWYYDEYLKCPKKYSEGASGAHMLFISEEFPKMLEWTDEECYEYAIRGYREDIENGETWCEIHEDGSLWKTTNENAKWDWYEMGGRYRGLLKLKDPSVEAPLYSGWGSEYDKEEYEKMKKEGRCDQACAGDVANLDSIVPFAVVKYGDWHERGEMGWWACVSNEKEKDVWEAEVRELLKGLPDDTLLTVVDCHI